jgi:hypothetical protein
VNPRNSILGSGGLTEEGVWVSRAFSIKIVSVLGSDQAHRSTRICEHSWDLLLEPATMTKHSKNNTASSVFSYAEYKKLDYGTKRQRLGNESMRLFNACSLCLERARIPLACSEGHLFCTECVFTDLGASLAFARPQRLIVDATYT